METERPSSRTAFTLVGGELDDQRLLLAVEVDLGGGDAAVLVADQIVGAGLAEPDAAGADGPAGMDRQARGGVALGARQALYWTWYTARIAE